MFQQYFISASTANSTMVYFLAVSLSGDKLDCPALISIYRACDTVAFKPT